MRDELVHRIVAIAFLLDPNDLPVTNHPCCSSPLSFP